MELRNSITSLKGVGPRVAETFKGIGISNIAELLDYFPRAYNDYSEIQTISKIKPGMVTIDVEIKQSAGRYVRRGMHITEAVASDATGSVRLVWFNQPYRAGAIKPSQKYFVTGKLELKAQHFSITNPSMEQASDFPLHTARIVPITAKAKALLQRYCAGYFTKLLNLPICFQNPYPKNKRKYRLVTYGAAVSELHFPSSKKPSQLLVIQLALSKFLN